MRINVNGATSTVGLGGLGGGSGANSGSSTPYGHPGGRSTLGNTVFAEEEEDEGLEMERIGRFGGLSGSVSPGVIGSGVYGIRSGGAYVENTIRMRTQTGSTTDTHLSNTSSGMAPSTALTTPDIESTVCKLVCTDGIGSYATHACGRTCHVRRRSSDRACQSCRT